MFRLTFALSGLAVAIGVAFVGCGSDDAPPADPGDGGLDGTAGDDGGNCKAVGTTCATGTECCTGACDPSTKICAKAGAVGKCVGAGGACTSGPECCTYACVDKACSAKQCTADNAVCAADGECCGGKCTGGKCVPLSGSCKTSGNPCGAGGECCSQTCTGGICDGAPSFCTQTGDSCATDSECCGGKCTKAAGATVGLCGVVGGSECKPAGSLCTGSGCDNTCCSLSCGPYGNTKVNICQPPSGCKPQNELCQKNEDCCGGPGLPAGITSNGGVNAPLSCVTEPGATYGRCPFEQCLRPGAVCKAEGNNCGGTSNNCCESQFPDGGRPSPSFCNSNPDACCSLDALGIPRCRAVNFVCGDGGTVPAGQLCATSADCCGKPCIDQKCQAGCAQTGNACTVNADCCSGLPCIIAPGSTKGVCGGGTVTPPSDGGAPPPSDGGGSLGCAAYGQDCTTAAQCCSGVPCSLGKCVYGIK